MSDEQPERRLAEGWYAPPAAKADRLRVASPDASASLLPAPEEEPGGGEEGNRPETQGGYLGTKLLHALACLTGAVAEHGGDRSDRRENVEEHVVEEMDGVGTAGDQTDDGGDDTAEQAHALDTKHREHRAPDAHENEHEDGHDHEIVGIQRLAAVDWDTYLAGDGAHRPHQDRDHSVGDQE